MLRLCKMQNICSSIKLVYLMQLKTCLDHILLHCPYYERVLRRVFLLLDIDLNTQFESWMRMLCHLGRTQLSTPHREVELMILQIHCYQTWTQRNQRFHEGDVLTPDELFYVIRDTMLELVLQHLPGWIVEHTCSQETPESSLTDLVLWFIHL